jgi:ADP-ribosylglycohydrolase
MKNVEGALVGMLVGDALGVPYEFTLPHGIPPKEAIRYTPPAGFRRAHKGTPPGTWSDDGALGMCLLASLLERNEFDATDFANRAVNWMNEGYMAVDNRVFDIGNATYKGLNRYANGQSPMTSGPTEENSNGNGSLMRVMPLALWHQGEDHELIRDARVQSKVTHGHLRSQLACAIYCIWARRLGSDWNWPSTEAAYQDAMDTVIKAHRNDPAVVHEVESFFRLPAKGTGSGYVVDSLHSTRMVLANTDNYEDCVKEAIRLGHDTDTTACIAGGMAGLIYGLPGIPKRWVENLRGKNILMPMLKQLRERNSTS